MSQLDLIAELREHRPVAPAELRQHVRALAATAPVRRRSRVGRRAFLVLAPIAAAALFAVAVLPRGDGPSSPELRSGREFAPSQDGQVLGTLTPESAGSAAAPPIAKTTAGAKLAPTAPPNSRTRAQDYSATLTLRLPTANAVSKATTRALQITASLGGYAKTVRVNATGKNGTAYLVLKVPVNRVQDAVQRLGALGTIVGGNVAIQDLQAGIDTTGRTIARLQQKLVELRALPQTEELTKQIAALEARVERLQRARAATLRSAKYATVELNLATPPAAVPTEDEDGPLHGLGVAFTWIGIGAVYALALGTPLVLLILLGWFLGRGVRRRREERLLSSQ